MTSLGRLKNVSVSLVILLGGCQTFQPDRVVRHPDGAMMVTEAKGDWLRVSGYDPATHSLVDAGWVSTSELTGWTFAKYDWSGFLRYDPEWPEGNNE
jgi:hypothetical protein